MKRLLIFSIAVFIGGITLGWGSGSMAADTPARESLTRNDALSNDNTSVQSSAFIKTSLNTSRRFRPNRLSADHVLVEKTKRRLTLFSDGEILKRYKISLGREPVGAKVRSGDNRTPEGLYYIDYRVEDSDFHLALHISYPNENDVRRARQMGYSPGGSIMLHGLKNDDDAIAYYHGVFDWTKGCIAVTNTEIEEIWKLVPNGTSIEIRP
ncbi:L,D-transpeptidase family protein [Kaarinaea lacus]